MHVVMNSELSIIGIAFDPMDRLDHNVADVCSSCVNDHSYTGACV